MVRSEPFSRIEARTTYGKVPPRKRPALGRRYRPEQDFSSELRRRDARRTGTPDPCSAALYGRVLKARGGSANICNSRVVGYTETNPESSCRLWSLRNTVNQFASKLYVQQLSIRHVAGPATIRI